MSSRWWTCTHDGIGLPGCPTCEARSPEKLDGAWMLRCARDARDEIARLTAKVDALRALPPETVADVRSAASYERSGALLASDRTRAEWSARAARLTALADVLDAAGVGRG